MPPPAPTPILFLWELTNSSLITNRGGKDKECYLEHA